MRDPFVFSEEKSIDGEFIRFMYNNFVSAVVEKGHLTGDLIEKYTNLHKEILYCLLENQPKKEKVFI